MKKKLSIVSYTAVALITAFLFSTPIPASAQTVEEQFASTSVIETTLVGYEALHNGIYSVTFDTVEISARSQAAPKAIVSGSKTRTRVYYNVFGGEVGKVTLTMNYKLNNGATISVSSVSSTQSCSFGNSISTPVLSSSVNASSTIASAKASFTFSTLGITIDNSGISFSVNKSGNFV